MNPKNLILSTDFAIKKSYITGKIDKEALTILATYNAVILYAEKRAGIDAKYTPSLNKLKSNLSIFISNCSNLCAVNDRVIYNSETL